MTYDEARVRAAAYLNENPRLAGKAMLDDTRTLDTGYSWVFFYESREFLDSGDAKKRLYGSLPIEIKKGDGSLRVIPLKEHWEMVKTFGHQEIQKSGRDS
jgi:Immunity protein 35